MDYRAEHVGGHSDDTCMGALRPPAFWSRWPRSYRHCTRRSLSCLKVRGREAKVNAVLVQSQNVLFVDKVRITVETVTLEGDPDEEEPHFLREDFQQRFRGTCSRTRGDCLAGVPRLDALLKRKIDDANRLHGLTDSQMQQLQLAGRGDLQRLDRSLRIVA